MLRLEGLKGSLAPASELPRAADGFTAATVARDAMSFVHCYFFVGVTIGV